MLELITQAPQWLQIVLLVCALIGAVVIYKFRYITSKIEIVCAKWYDQARRDLLGMYTWNFAKRRELCAKNATSPAFGYSNQYQLPADYIRLVFLGQNSKEFKLQYQDYAREGNKILINYEGNSLPMCYIFNEDVTGNFSPWFVNALSYYLALLMSNEINQSNTDIQTLDAQFKDKLSIAKKLDTQEQPVKVVYYNSLESGY